jgi:D-alanyl-D-alanine carboxypeptidase
MLANIIHKGKKPVHNFLLYARNGKTGFEINKGVGTIGRNNIEIDAGYQYNVASITKTLVATIILQLEEEGKLSTEDKACRYLDNMDFLKFTKIHLLNDTSYAREITIQQLLQHTSGIADIFFDATKRFKFSVLTHKNKQYNTEKIIQKYYKYNLNKKPFNKPGKGYHYSGINYMLLGFIIEQVTGKSLAECIRERIINKLNLKDTWFEYYEPSHGSGKRIDAFLNRLNMTKKINTSFEWAAGGLVSTTRDMGVFIESLFSMELFRDVKTLAKMIDISETEKYGGKNGMGFFKYKLDGQIYYGHGGYFGSFLAFNPNDRITFSVNVGQANPPFDREKLITELLKIITSQ